MTVRSSKLLIFATSQLLFFLSINLVRLEEHRLLEGVEEILVGLGLRHGAALVLRAGPHEQLLLPPGRTGTVIRRLA